MSAFASGCASASARVAADNVAPPFITGTLHVNRRALGFGVSVMVTVTSGTSRLGAGRVGDAAVGEGAGAGADGRGGCAEGDGAACGRTKRASRRARRDGNLTSRRSNGPSRVGAA